MANTMTLTHDMTLVNLDLLHEELAAVLEADFTGVSFSRGQLRVHVLESTTQAQINLIQPVLAAHDPSNQTIEQQASALAEQAESNVVAIPGWASWSEQQALDYINTNVTDLDSAKTVLLAMARMLVALRNRTWPQLGVN